MLGQVGEISGLIARTKAIKAGLYKLGSRGGSLKKVKPSRLGTTLYEWLPICLALSDQVGVPLEHAAHHQNPTNWSSNFQSAASA